MSPQLTVLQGVEGQSPALKVTFSLLHPVRLAGPRECARDSPWAVEKASDLFTFCSPRGKCANDIENDWQKISALFPLSKVRFLLCFSHPLPRMQREKARFLSSAQLLPRKHRGKHSRPEPLSDFRSHQLCLRLRRPRGRPRPRCPRSGGSTPATTGSATRTPRRKTRVSLSHFVSS